MESTALHRLDPNTADVEALMELPGVGRAMAERIIDARPFRSPDDLRRVAGLGEVGVARLAPHMQFPASTPAKKAADAPPPAPRRAPQARLGLEASAPLSQRQLLWGAAISVAIAVGLSMVLTLAVFAGINGTLDIGRAQAVRQLEADLSAAQVELGSVGQTLVSVSSRLDALQGLTGRMTTVEGQVSDMRQDIDLAMEQVDGLQGDLEEVRDATEALSARADRFDAFLDGLRALLGEAGPAEEDVP